MADASPKSAARGPEREPRARGVSRTKIAGKLLLLLGLPLFVIFSIFASGVYCGATRADRVVELEHRWLGIEPPPGRLVGDGDELTGETGEPTEPKSTEPTQPTEPTEPTQPTEPKPTEPTQPTEPNPTQPAVEPSQPASGLAIAKADPVGEELRKRFDEARAVDVQIMVDPALVVAREDWLSYVAGLFEATRASFDVLFGIDLQLHGVVVWDAAAGADAAELLAELGSRDHEGADVILGLLARERPRGFAAPSWIGEVNGDHALVFADLQQSDRYYRNSLRELALLFGAEPARDPAAEQLGSFMSDAVMPAGAAPVLDAENRGRVIINKRRKFVEPPKPATPQPADDTSSDDLPESGEDDLR